MPDILFDFLGYGKLTSDYWFMGMEDGGGSPELIEARKNIKDNPADCRAVHLELFQDEKWHGDNASIQKTWKGPCLFMLAINSNRPSRNFARSDKVEYQRFCLGRLNDKSNSFITELLPLPAKNINTWPNYFPYNNFANRADYRRQVLPIRIKRFKELIGEYQPKVIVCYGAEYWDHYQTIFFCTRLDEKPFENSSVRHGISSFGTQVFFTHHFTAPTMNTDTYEVIDWMVEMSRRNDV